MYTQTPGVSSKMDQPNRILIVRPSALGDVCRTVPVLVTLRSAHPRATIDWIVQDEFAAAIASHPDLDEAVTFPRRRFARWWRSPQAALEMWRWFEALRRRRYDLVLDFQGLSRSGLITLGTRARRRVGVRSAREFGWLAYNVRHAPAPARHEVERMMSIVVAEGLEPVYDMRLYAAEADRSWWQARRAELDMPSARYAVLAPTSRWPSKSWPQESFSALIEPLRGRGFQRIVLIGSPSECDQVDRITRTPGIVVDLVGKTDVGRMMAVIAGASLVIGNDSAPLHLAVGFDRPCVGLYGPTDPAQQGPYGHQATTRICRGQSAGAANFKSPRLGDRLMRLIPPSEVLDCVDELMAAQLSPA